MAGTAFPMQVRHPFPVGNFRPGRRPERILTTLPEARWASPPASLAVPGGGPGLAGPARGR